MMLTKTRYEIEYSDFYASFVVRDVLTGAKLGMTTTRRGAFFLRRNIAHRLGRTLFIPELDGPTVSAEDQYAANERYELEQESQQYEDEARAENAWLRAAESPDLRDLPDNGGYIDA